MAKAIPWSWCCEGNSLSNEGIFMILLPQLLLTVFLCKYTKNLCKSKGFHNSFLRVYVPCKERTC